MPLVVLRLMTRSNLVGRSTEGLPGCARLRIRRHAVHARGRLRRKHESLITKADKLLTRTQASIKTRTRKLGVDLIL